MVPTYKLDGETSKIRTIVEEGRVLKVGDGASISFWHGKWCDMGPLKREFPRLFSISLQQNLFINQMGFWEDDVWRWNLFWRRGLYEWEIEEFSRLEAAINLNCPRKEGFDDISWCGSTQSDYPIRGIAEKIYDSSTTIIPNKFLKSIWHKHIPPRAQLTLWFAFLGKLKTRDFLLDKGIIGPIKHCALFLLWR